MALVRAEGGTARRADSIMLLGGVVGFKLPPLRPSTTPVEAGDLLILATDGISDGYLPGLDPAAGPRALADRILAEHARGGDDALVVPALGARRAEPIHGLALRVWPIETTLQAVLHGVYQVLARLNHAPAYRAILVIDR